MAKPRSLLEDPGPRERSAGTDLLAAIVRAGRENDLLSGASAFLLFMQITEREGLDEALRIYLRIVRLHRETMSGKRPRKSKPKSNRRLNSLRLVSAWKIWKAQNPSGTKAEFERWFNKFTGKTFFEPRSQIRQLNRKLAEQSERSE